MRRKYGVDTDEADEESYNFAKEYDAQQAAEDWSSTELRRRYENLKQVTLDNLPNLWPGLEFALSIKTILNIKECTLPFIGILLGPASSLKTVIVDLFKGYRHTFYTDHFSPRSIVSHSSGLNAKQLRKVDLLPKMKNKYFLTPELAPIFAARDDDLLQVLGILTRIADGQGYVSDSGVQGHRGYEGDMMFAWLGASVDIPYKVHRLLGTLGPKLYFFRLPRVEEDEDYYYNTRSDDFKVKRQKIQSALFEYLEYFDMNPQITIEKDISIIHDDEKEAQEEGLPKIAMNTSLDEEQADRIIIRLCKLLAHLRAVVPTWETRGTQGSEYGYALPKIEDPTRAITQMRNLARGHALSLGGTHFTMDDIPIVIHTVLSTASTERVRIFDLLLANRGVLTTSQICDFLDVSKPTALRTMTELKVAGIVDMPSQQEVIDQNSTAVKEIRLKQKFEWFLSDEFKQLRETNIARRRKEKTPPQKTVVQTVLYDCIINRKILGTLQSDPFWGENSLHPPDKAGEQVVDNSSCIVKPLEQWTHRDFQINGCIYCNNNGGYYGPSPLTADEYEIHIVNKHPGKPGYPGPADIQKYGLKLDARGKE